MYGVQKPLLGSQIDLSHPLSQGLTHCFLFNEGSGKVLNNYGTDRSSPYTFYGLTNGWISGPDGSALNFGGTPDYIDAGVLKCSQGATQLTFIMWIKRTSLLYPAGFYQSTDNSHDFGIYMYPDNNLYFDIGNGSNSYGSVANTDLTWQCIAGVFDGTQAAANRVKAYVNGVLQPLSISGTFPTSVYSAVQNAYIGYSDTLGYLAQTLSQIMVYNRALDSNEIARLIEDPYCMFEPRIFQDWFPIISALSYLSHVAKYNGVTKASIGKIHGISKSAIKSINGVN